MRFLFLCPDVSDTCVHAAVCVFVSEPKRSRAGMRWGWHHPWQQHPQDTLTFHAWRGAGAGAVPLGGYRFFTLLHLNFGVFLRQKLQVLLT